MTTATTALPLSEESERYGISRVATEHFEYGGYRYTNLKDAVAEAKRREPKPGAAS